MSEERIGGSGMQVRRAITGQGRDGKSVDCMMQVSGESVFVLEESEVRLGPGDWLISNGVRHDWRNDGEEVSGMIGVVSGRGRRERVDG